MAKCHFRYAEKAAERWRAVPAKLVKK
ncbi:hypothetical protein PUN4_990004 [Paraburkholderia unamae]|nr:hypothetical protein PUN4_990004 [Paraburkholderia unamae]